MPKHVMLTALWLVTGCLLFSSGSGAAKPLRIGYFTVAPHAMPDAEGRPQGAAVAYFELVAQEMGSPETEYILLPLSRLLLELENDRIDMALLLAKDHERGAKFVYPARPFCVTKPSIAVSADLAPQKIQSVDDLLPLTFHETPGNYRTPIMRDPRLRIEPLAGENFTRRCCAMITAGRIDACYQPDHYPIQYEATRGAYASRVTILYLPDPPIGLYSVFSKTGARLYRKRYEKALDAVKQAHTYSRVYEKVRAECRGHG